MAWQRTNIQVGDSILLRPWRLSDVDDAYAYGSDPEWARYLWFVPQPYSQQDAQQFIERAVADPWESQAQFAIEMDGHAVGGIHLYLMDANAHVAGLGYNVARSHWGRGIATQAARAVIEYGISVLGIRKFVSTADARNAGSVRVMQKLGMQQEGLLRQNRFYRGDYADEIVYAFLTPGVEP